MATQPDPQTQEATVQQTPAELINQGDQLLKESKLAEAIVAYEQAVQLKPSSAAFHYKLGHALLQQGEMEKAKACYEQSVELDPMLHWGHYGLAQVASRLEQWEQAAAAYRQAIELKPRFVAAEQELKALLEQCGRREAANEDDPIGTDSCLDPEPENGCSEENAQLDGQQTNEQITSGQLIQLGNRLVEEKKFDEAIDAYSQAVKLQPESAAPHYKLGSAYLLQGDLQQAKQYFKEAISLEPDFHWAYYGLGELADACGQLEDSIIAYQQAVELAPEHLFSYQKLGEAQIKLKAWKEAEQSFQRTVELDPSFYWGYYRLGEVLTEQGNLEKALAAYRKMCELTSLPEALHKLQEVVSLLQKTPLTALSLRTICLLGDALSYLRQWNAAITTYRHAKLLDPSIVGIDEKLKYVEQQQQVQQPISLVQYLTVETDTNNAFAARLTEVELGGILKGWAIDNGNPDLPVKFKLLIDEEQVAVVETKSFKKSAAVLAGVDSARQFEVPLPFLLRKEVLLNGKPRFVQLIPIATSSDQLKPVLAQVIFPSRGFGRIESWVNGCVRGWAIPDGHLESAAVDIYINDVFYSTTKANLSRMDLAKHGLGNGNNGFEISIPASIGRGKHQVDVVFSETDCKLQTSPLTIEFSEAEYEKCRDRQLKQFSSVARMIARETATSNITIVVPIFNAYEAVHDCIQSVLKNTSLEVRLVLINDASTDERIIPLLQWAASFSNVKSINNSENLGYTKTINIGIEFADNDDVVLLNSDTIVGPQWLQNLRIAAYHDIDIGTVTAISDNAGAFSAPKLGVANEMPVWLSSSELARAISHHSQSIYPEVPTGSGFCLYIRRTLLNDIGLFDEIAFSRGYGEENDFCMRALRAGWRHIVDDRTLVRHVRSASFKGEKQALIAAGRKVVYERYPEYGALTPIFSRSFELHTVRYNVRKVIESRKSLRRRVLPRVLYVISTQTGGTPQTNEDLMAGLADRYHTLMLRCDSKEITLYDTSCQPYTICETFRLQTPISPATHRSVEYDKIVSGLLAKYSIELLHIRHVAWHSLSLPWIAKQLGIPVIFSFHDFYTICPTVNLLDDNRVFCGGRCTESEGQCNVLLWPKGEMPPLKHQFIKTWQEMVAEMLQSVDAVVTTADSAKQQIQAIYPSLERTPFQVIPHGRDFLELKQGLTQPEQILSPSQPIRILFPGNISIHKGAEIIAELQQLNVEGRFEFHFLGTTDKLLAEIGQHHGTYERSDYGKLVQKICPHYVGIFSIWPETYCHTLTESWASGIPAIAIDQGAVGDRIRCHGGGWLLNTADPTRIYARLLEIANDVEGYSQKVADVRRWQQSYGRQNNISTMAAKYHDLYQQVLGEARSFKSAESPQKLIKVGVFIQRDRQQQANPSTHIRVLEWMQHPEISQRIDAQFLEIDAFLQDQHHVFELDAVLVQRNTIKPYLVQQFVQRCRQRGLPIVFELDDDLMNVPPDKDPTRFYTRAAGAIEQLAQAAATVVVSTEPLAARMRSLNPNVVVIPNAIAEFAWFAPLEKVEDLPAAILETREALKVIYMGNPTHSEDLAMVRPVFERLRREGKSIKLFVVGGEPEENTSGDWYQRLIVPSSNRHYPEFVKWFRSIAPCFDLAIAPLVDTEFNRCKSALKFIQYGAVGLAGIYSDCLPYSNIVSDGIDSFLVENTEESWYNKLLHYISDKEGLEELGQIAKSSVLQRHLMTQYTDTYAKMFSKCLKD